MTTKLGGDHHAIMWISSKGVSFNDEKDLVTVAQRTLGDEISFIGFCFGRFDLIIEFSHESARVASYKVCNLQKALDVALEKKGKSNAICSSLTLCSMVGEEVNFNSKIKIYTFLRPKDSVVDLDKLKEKVLKLSAEDKKTAIQLGWNTSLYSFLLIVGGDRFSEAFDKMQKFREETKNYFSDSCTYVGFNWDSDPDKDSIEINATTFVRTVDGFEWLELDDVDWRIWNPRSVRLGWSDICLFTRSKSLFEIKQRILNLREKCHVDRGQKRRNAGVDFHKM